MASVFTKRSSDKKPFSIKISADLLERKSELEKNLSQVNPELKLNLVSKIETLIEDIVDKGEKELAKMLETADQN